VVGNGRLDPKNLPRNELISQYFNAAAFALPATGLSGNSGRNNLVGPGFFNADVAMQKDSGRRSPKEQGHSNSAARCSTCQLRQPGQPEQRYEFHRVWKNQFLARRENLSVRVALRLLIS